MGYYTDYKVRIIDNGSELVPDPNWDERLHEWSQGYWFDEGTLSDAKWYFHEENMEDLSKAFPEFAFKVYGKGEDEGDLWIKYFKNGIMKKVKGTIKITYEKLSAAQKKYYGII